VSVASTTDASSVVHAQDVGHIANHVHDLDELCRFFGTTLSEPFILDANNHSGTGPPCIPGLEITALRPDSTPIASMSVDFDNHQTFAFTYPLFLEYSEPYNIDIPSTWPQNRPSDRLKRSPDPRVYTSSFDGRPHVLTLRMLTSVMHTVDWLHDKRTTRWRRISDPDFTGPPPRDNNPEQGCSPRQFSNKFSQIEREQVSFPPIAAFRIRIPFQTLQQLAERDSFAQFRGMANYD